VTRYIPSSRKTAASGHLRLEIRPSSATVDVDGRVVGRVDKFGGKSEGLALAAGSHVVVIRASGYEPLEIETLTRAGETTTYSGTLARSIGSEK